MDPSFLFPLLILFMIGLLFMSSRQRKKQQQQHDALTRSLNVGDVVRMSSGISGTIVDVDDEQTIDIEIAEDVVTTWLRAAVREKLVAEDEGDDASSGLGELDPADAPADDAVGGTPTSGAPDLSKSTEDAESTVSGSTGSSRSS